MRTKVEAPGFRDVSCRRGLVLEGRDPRPWAPGGSSSAHCMACLLVSRRGVVCPRWTRGPRRPRPGGGAACSRCLAPGAAARLLRPSRCEAHAGLSAAGPPQAADSASLNWCGHNAVGLPSLPPREAGVCAAWPDLCCSPGSCSWPSCAGTWGCLCRPWPGGCGGRLLAVVEGCDVWFWAPRGLCGRFSACWGSEHKAHAPVCPADPSVCPADPPPVCPADPPCMPS